MLWNMVLATLFVIVPILLLNAFVFSPHIIGSLVSVSILVFVCGGTLYFVGNGRVIGDGGRAGRRLKPRDTRRIVATQQQVSLQKGAGDIDRQLQKGCL